MTDRATVSNLPGYRQDEPKQWWGYSKEHGWVVLDRSLPCNMPSLKVDLLFLRCRDVTTFSEKREHWIPPRYRFAPNYIKELAAPDADAAAIEFARLQVRWPEFEREIQVVHQAANNEDKAHKRSAAETKKSPAAAKT